MDDLAVIRIMQATQEIRTLIDNDRHLDPVDQLRIENSMAMLQMTYIEWKRRNIPPDPPYWASSFHDDSSQRKAA